MILDQFCLTDEQFSKIAPYLPADTRAKARVDDRQAVGEHPRADPRCRPIAFMLNGGSVADCTAGAELLAHLPPCEILHGDKGYDNDAILAAQNFLN